MVAEGLAAPGGENRQERFVAHSSFRDVALQRATVRERTKIVKPEKALQLMPGIVVDAAVAAAGIPARATSQTVKRVVQLGPPVPHPGGDDGIGACFRKPRKCVNEKHRPSGVGEAFVCPLRRLIRTGVGGEGGQKGLSQGRLVHENRGEFSEKAAEPLKKAGKSRVLRSGKEGREKRENCGRAFSEGSPLVRQKRETEFGVVYRVVYGVGYDFVVFDEPVIGICGKSERRKKERIDDGDVRKMRIGAVFKEPRNVKSQKIVADESPFFVEQSGENPVHFLRSLGEKRFFRRHGGKRHKTAVARRFQIECRQVLIGRKK